MAVMENPMNRLCWQERTEMAAFLRKQGRYISAIELARKAKQDVDPTLLITDEEYFIWNKLWWKAFG